MSSTTKLERKVNCDSVKHQKEEDDDWLCALSIFSVIAPAAAASSSEVVVVVVKLKLKLKSGERVVAAEDTLVKGWGQLLCTARALGVH